MWDLRQVEKDLKEELSRMLRVVRLINPQSDEEFIAAALPNLLLWVHQYHQKHCTSQDFKEKTGEESLSVSHTVTGKNSILVTGEEEDWKEELRRLVREASLSSDPVISMRNEPIIAFVEKAKKEAREEVLGEASIAVGKVARESRRDTLEALKGKVSGMRRDEYPTNEHNAGLDAVLEAINSMYEK